MSTTETTTPRSNRHGESEESFARRLARARLTKSQHAEIDAIYAALDAEWPAEGRTTLPERAPWTALEILEWQDLNTRERYLDLKGYARASDRIAAANRTAHVIPLAA